MASPSNRRWKESFNQLDSNHFHDVIIGDGEISEQCTKLAIAHGLLIDGCCTRHTTGRQQIVFAEFLF